MLISFFLKVKTKASKIAQWIKALAMAWKAPPTHLGTHAHIPHNMHVCIHKKCKIIFENKCKTHKSHVW